MEDTMAMSPRHYRAGAYINSQSLWQHAHGLNSCKPDRVPALREEVDKSPHSYRTYL